MLKDYFENGTTVPKPDGTMLTIFSMWLSRFLHASQFRHCGKWYSRSTEENMKTVISSIPRAAMGFPEVHSATAALGIPLLRVSFGILAGKAT